MSQTWATNPDPEGVMSRAGTYGYLSNDEASYIKSGFHGITLTKHKVLDFPTIAIHSAPPAIIFFLVFWLTAWWPRWTHGGVSVVAAAVIAGVGIYFAVKRLAAAIKNTEHRRNIAWETTLLLQILTAVIFAFVIGDYCYAEYTRPYFEYQMLQNYAFVDPSKDHGAQVADAGRVYFSPGTQLDRTKAGCFVNGDTYCIAPIVPNGDLESLPEGKGNDFFAIGMNCCSCPAVEFHCGNWAARDARAGLRLVDETSRSFYRLAVEQWAAMWEKTAEHPTFFYWSTNPMQDERLLKAWALNYWGYGTTLILVGAIVFALCMEIGLNLYDNSKMRYPQRPEFRNYNTNGSA